MDARTGVLDIGELWRLTMEHSPVGMAIVAPDGRIVVANAALGEMLGYDPLELATRTVEDLTHPDDLAPDLELIRQAVDGTMASYRIHKRCIRSDGAVLHGELSALLLRSADGQPLHFIMQIIDRTDVHAFAERLDAAEEVAQTASARAEAIFEAAGVGLLMVDADGRTVAHNRQHQELLEMAFPEGHRGLPGQVGFVYDADQSRLLAREEMPSVRAARGEYFQDVLVWIGQQESTRRALSVTARPVRDRTGTVIGAAVASDDVTDLLRATRAKDQFVAAVSHELRTPLTAAMAYLELLDETLDELPEARQQVTAARRNILRLSHLVADLIFSTRASSGSSGAPVIAPYRLDLVTVLREAVDAAAVDADGAGVHLTSEHPVAVEVVADGMRLRQVLDNLIANAIRFGRPDGRVDVTLTEDDEWVVLTVADDGEGIEPEDVPEVFDRFFRGENARRRQISGTGLGLHIVRTIVEAHGGQVSVDSAAGVGTTVRVELPR